MALLGHNELKPVMVYTSLDLMLTYPPQDLKKKTLLAAFDQLIEVEGCIYATVKHTNIGSDNGLSPVRRQAIISTNTAILSIRP